MKLRPSLAMKLRIFNRNSKFTFILIIIFHALLVLFVIDYFSMNRNNRSNSISMASQIDSSKHGRDSETKDMNRILPKTSLTDEAEVRNKMTIMQGNKDQQTLKKYVHFDLKGAAPRMTYLLEILPFIRDLGVSGILVEYEDTFPYTSELEIISAKNPYSKQEIETFYRAAQKMGLEFIPLIQTFGHLEFVLKLQNFGHLREIPVYPQAICPTHDETIPLIKNVIDQIISLHPGIRWLHIGADEVYHLAECNRCQSYLSSNGLQKYDLFLEHVAKIASYLTETHKVRAIMWDDMLRKIPLSDLMKSSLGKYADIMIWKYSPGILEEIDNNIWEKYSRVFKGIWVAGAFKGATAPNTFLTPIDERLENTAEWLDVINLHKNTIPLNGMVLTGWQRYDHFAILCEFFPQAIPSLAVSLEYLNSGKKDHATLSKVGKKLGCDSFLNIDLRFIEYVNDCKFPGSEIYELTQRLFILKNEFTSFSNRNYMKGWLTDYNIRNKFSSPHYVERDLQGLNSLMIEMEKLNGSIHAEFIKVFDKHTVQEWYAINIEGLMRRAAELYNARKILLSQTYWPRRPILDAGGIV